MVLLERSENKNQTQELAVLSKNDFVGVSQQKQVREQSNFCGKSSRELIPIPIPKYDVISKGKERERKGKERKRRQTLE